MWAILTFAHLLPWIFPCRSINLYSRYLFQIVPHKFYQSHKVKVDILAVVELWLEAWIHLQEAELWSETKGIVGYVNAITIRRCEEACLEHMQTNLLGHKTCFCAETFCTLLLDNDEIYWPEPYFLHSYPETVEQRFNGFFIKEPWMWRWSLDYKNAA